MDQPLSKKAHWPPFYIYLQSVAIAIVVWWMTQGLYHDDSYITLVYVRNWLDGFGLVWSRGDVPVEGYTNFLFMMLVTILGWFGVDLVLATRIISFASYFGLVFTLFWFTQTLYRKNYASSERYYAHKVNSALCVGLVISSAPILAWCFGGLEAVFFAFLLTAAICRILLWLEFGASYKAIFITGVIFALATMTRLEALMIWGITGIILGLFWLSRNHKEHITFARLLLLGFGFLAIFAPYMLWKFSYYGELLPNTYYAKVYGIPAALLTKLGWVYILQSITLPPLLPLMAIGLMVVMRREIAASRSVLYLFIIAAAFVWHIVTSGGDHMKYLRFFVPVVPIFSLLIYYAAGYMIEKNEKWFRDFSGALIVLCVLQFGYVSYDDQIPRNAVNRQSAASYVNTHWEKDSLIALNPAGALPYYAPSFRYIDMIGLNDKVISQRVITPDLVSKGLTGLAAGHHKGDGEYILSRSPDYIIFGGTALGQKNPSFLSDLELVESEEFKSDYRLVEIYVQPPKSLRSTLQAIIETPTPEALLTINEKGQVLFTYYERIR